MSDTEGTEREARALAKIGTRYWRTNHRVQTVLTGGERGNLVRITE